MHRNGITALWLGVTITFLGCQVLQSNRLSSAKPDTNGHVKRLLQYYHDTNAFSPETLQQEYERKMQSPGKDGCSEELLQVGILLALTPVSVWPKKIDTDLLRPCLGLENPKVAQSPIGHMALFLHKAIHEKGILAKRLQSIENLLKKERELLEKERQRNETLHRQLYELKAIEKSIHERERSQGNTNVQE